MLLRQTFRRSPRAHEWSDAKAVTFIVTLAASGNVTLAATRASMSRKSAYALERRDPAFAAAWVEAVRCASRPVQRTLPKGDEVDELYSPRVRSPKGDRRRHGALDETMHDPFFAAFTTRNLDHAMALLADAPPLP